MAKYPRLQQDQDNAFASTFGILIHDHFNIEYVDDNLCRIFGAENSDTLLNLPDLLSVLCDCDPQAERAFYAELMSGQASPRILTFRLTKPSGEVVHVLIAESIIHWKDKMAVQLSVIDITEKYNDFSSLEKKAYIDSLSGLTNRHGFERILECEISRARKYGYPISCLFIDIDNFKTINDTYGHHVGDDVITLFAQSCKNSFRQTDFIGRWGGEEFLILLPNTPQQYCHMLAERLRQDVAHQSVTVQDDKCLSFTISIGTQTQQDGNYHAQQLVRQSDIALNHAKKHGKNQVVAFHDICRQKADK